MPFRREEPLWKKNREVLALTRAWRAVFHVADSTCSARNRNEVLGSLLIHTLYRILGKVAGLFFNILNVCLAGNLPPLGTVAVIVEDKGRYLLLRRSEDRLVFPGGFMRWREHPTQAAVREFREETGLQVTLLHLVTWSSYMSKNVAGISTLTLVFCGELCGGEMRGGVEGQPCWIEESSLLEMIDVRSISMLNAYREQRDNGTYVM